MPKDEDDEDIEEFQREFWAEDLEPKKKKLSKREIKYREEAAELIARSGRYEEAAQRYQDLAVATDDVKYLDKARELRDKMRGTKVTIVSADLNKLLQQLKEGGIVIAYACPVCGGKLNISGETEATSLNYCSYCGSKIDTMKLADFLRAAL